MSTNDQPEKSHVNAEKLLTSLEHDLFEAYASWKMLCQLTRDQETIDLLNNIAPNFFGIVENRLQDDIFLRLARVTDPAQSGRSNENVSLEGMIVYLAKESELGQAVGKFKTLCDPLRKHRNKRIGHRDLATIVEKKVALPPVSLEDMDAIFAAADELLLELRKALKSSPRLLRNLVVVGDAESLISTLEYYKAFRDAAQNSDSIMQVFIEARNRRAGRTSDRG